MDEFEFKRIRVCRRCKKRFRVFPIEDHLPYFLCAGCYTILQPDFPEIVLNPQKNGCIAQPWFEKPEEAA